MMKNNKSGHFLGNAYITLESKVEVQKALKINGYPMKNRFIKIINCKLPYDQLNTDLNLIPDEKITGQESNTTTSNTNSQDDEERLVKLEINPIDDQLIESDFQKYVEFNKKRNEGNKGYTFNSKKGGLKDLKQINSENKLPNYYNQVIYQEINYCNSNNNYYKDGDQNLSFNYDQNQMIMLGQNQLYNGNTQYESYRHGGSYYNQPDYGNGINNDEQEYYNYPYYTGSYPNNQQSQEGYYNYAYNSTNQNYGEEKFYHNKPPPIVNFNQYYQQNYDNSSHNTNEVFTMNSKNLKNYAKSSPIIQENISDLTNIENHWRHDL